MRITTLLENTTLSADLKQKHGLCLYIESGENKILFDVGPDEKFLQNAMKLGIDIAEVDTVIISHGHSDHGGGLKEFLEANQKAKIYIHKRAFDTHTVRILPEIHKNVSLDPTLRHNERIIFNDDCLTIHDGMLLFSHVEGDQMRSRFNDILYTSVDGKSQVDTFEHEQHLIISEGGRNALIAGCSHRGIVNILAGAEKIYGKEMDLVVAGFHLFNPTAGISESQDLVRSIAQVLNEKNTRYYTGHCTGQKAFEWMQIIMGEKIQPISTGSRIEGF